MSLSRKNTGLVRDGSKSTCMGEEQFNAIDSEMVYRQPKLKVAVVNNPELSSSCPTKEGGGLAQTRQLSVPPVSYGFKLNDRVVTDKNIAIRSTLLRYEKPKVVWKWPQRGDIRLAIARCSHLEAELAHPRKKREMKSHMNSTISEEEGLFFIKISFYSSILLTIVSIVALAVNLYLLNCSRYLRRPIGVNLRLCVSLTASDALCAFFYILTYLINVILPNLLSNCVQVGYVFRIRFHFVSAGIESLHWNNCDTHGNVRCLLALLTLCLQTVSCPCFVQYRWFRAPIAFAFFSKDGCRGMELRNVVVRWVLVAPFILFVLLISFLYLHILVHMHNVSKDPLLKAKKTKRTTNRKLLVTIMLLAGSACLGWLPTTVLFVLICDSCLFQLPLRATMYLRILSHLLNVLKLIADAFIYASRLVEIRYAMWIFHASVYRKFSGIFGWKPLPRPIPPEFTRYLSETTEHRSIRNKRAHVIQNKFSGRTIRKSSVNSRDVIDVTTSLSPKARGSFDGRPVSIHLSITETV
ncbi:hypothetical protein OSTOST_00629 [Ostertagia ostertagi]